MSQSENSSDNTVVPVKFVDTMSVQEEDEEEGSVHAEVVEVTMVLKEDLELMMQRVHEAIDASWEVLAVLQQLHRSMGTGSRR